MLQQLEGGYQGGQKHCLLLEPSQTDGLIKLTE